MSFEENMTAFYMAFAEQTLEPMCQALSNMRLVAQNDRVEQHTSAPHAKEDANVREEMLLACELKAQAMQPVALEQLQRACSTNGNPDIDAVLTAFFLCAELGAETDGVAPFGECLSRIFTTQARACFDRVGTLKQTATVNENGYIDRGFYVDAIREILTGSTDIMNAVADVSANPVILLQVLRPIHDICADIILEIVHMYAIDARMTAWERRALAQARRQPSSGETDVEADESLQMIDLFLDEVSFIIRIIMSYSSFLKTICDGLDGDRSSSFQVKIQELNGVYLILERFYVFQSVHKATAIAEVQELEPQVFVSSSVEDVSFVLHKSFFRASQCMNYHTALSVVIAIVDALESMYLPSILQLPHRDFVIPFPSTAPSAGDDSNASSERIEDGEAKKEISFSDMLLQAVDDDLTRSIQDEAKLILAINSAFMSGEFVEGLHAKIEEFSMVSFPQEANIVECLPKHIRELTEMFRSVVDTEIQEVLSRGIRKRMEALVHKLMNETFNYVISPSQYDTFGLHGSPLNKMVEHEVMQNKVLRRYERALCAPPFESLVEYFVQDLTTWLAQALLVSRKPFNDLGALQLEREVSDMLTRVSAFVQQKSLRASFTRLFQLVLILNLMDPHHVVDYLESVTDELSADELETLLRMRVDFKSDDVAVAVRQMKNAIAATTAATR
uniref:COG4 transport protein middle alpha-helical bundle domain-containing protein n=1 Tax=Globisporangium ultimum (strain ATCC 200006 / CBS 805.95 / DAOM BR144) TaxID=431595 RepID=K3XB07_GLOUD